MSGVRANTVAVGDEFECRHMGREITAQKLRHLHVHVCYRAELEVDSTQIVDRKYVFGFYRPHIHHSGACGEQGNF
ncbi:MAG: hypothetical protein LBB48_07930 [Treponema sp.]|nr:hypothetical protein [Treponema sp.]